MVLGDAVSKLQTFVWILSHISRSITLSLFTLKASYLVKWPISTWSFMWWCQFIDWLKFETPPSSRNWGEFRLAVPKFSRACWISERPIEPTTGSGESLTFYIRPFVLDFFDMEKEKFLRQFVLLFSFDFLEERPGVQPERQWSQLSCSFGTRKFWRRQCAVKWVLNTARGFKAASWASRNKKGNVECYFKD